MTREEAIKIIDCYDIGFYDLSGEKIPADKLADAFDMAIEALQTPPISQRSMYQAGYRQGREEALKREPSEDGTQGDLIIKGAGGIKDGLYVIKDGEMFKYKSKGGTVRTYTIVDRPRGEWIE